jgi:phosphatidylserine/phosphatidylglycerophosphate/cardiolipin synthase-like enzyme
MKKKIFFTTSAIVILVTVHGWSKPLPSGVSVTGTQYSVPASSIQFFGDVTFVDATGNRHSEQQVFDEIFRMIDDARSYILLDLFLFNDYIGTATTSFRQLSQELTDKLIEKKKLSPEIKIQLITDTINEFYGGSRSHQFEALENNGIEVIITDLKPLRDSNPLYSGIWRTFFQWFGNDYREGFFPNLLHSSGQKVSFRSYLSSFNFKANHRKVVMTDYIRGDKIGFSTLITSANPHDGSSAHSNSAVRIDDYIWQDVLTTERAVAVFSKKTFIEPAAEFFEKMTDTDGEVSVQLLTEKAIRDAVIFSINDLEKDDTLDMAMFYLADRKVIKALKSADERGVKIRILLDPNKDAFGREKNGMPNRQVASELVKNTNGNTKIRWCDTHGEQCHSKLLLFKTAKSYEMIIGSANLTRRNIGDFNLETNVYILSNNQIDAINDAYAFFNKTWENELDISYSVGYDFYKDESGFKKVRYRIKEFLGTNRW